MNESSRFGYLFDLAGNPKALWDARAEIPGFGSVMSLGKTEETCKEETERSRTHLYLELGNISDKKVLEIGTGIGRFTNGLSERALSVVSVDISRKMLNRAAVDRRGNVELIQAVGQNLPLKDGRFDIVFESTVLIHLNDEEFKGFTNETMRVLKPGGKLIFYGPIAIDKTVQIHPYLKHRTTNDYEQATGVSLEDRGSVLLSNVECQLLIGEKPLC